MVPDEDEILKLTMGVVKTVKELSDKVHKSKPGDYVDLVKVSGSIGVFYSALPPIQPLVISLVYTAILTHFRLHHYIEVDSYPSTRPEVG